MRAFMPNLAPLRVLSADARFPLMEIVPRLQVLEVRGKEDALRGLPGIYFDAARVAHAVVIVAAHLSVTIQVAGVASLVLRRRRSSATNQ